MATYFRFQNEAPRRGESVHCFRTLNGLKNFVRMMKAQDPRFYRMKFWEVEGMVIRLDDGDVVVQVSSVKQISI